VNQLEKGAAATAKVATLNVGASRPRAKRGWLGAAATILLQKGKKRKSIVFRRGREEAGAVRRHSKTGDELPA